MPCRYVIDKEHRLVISTAWDRLTYAEIDALYQRLLSDPDFDPEFDHLSDARSVTTVDVSVAEVKRIASQRVFSSSSRRAWIAKEPQAFGMFRMAAAYKQLSDARSTQLCAFYSLPAALEWLGLKSLPDALKSEGTTARNGASASENKAP